MAYLNRAFQKKELQDPGFIRAIFGSTWLAPLWLVARVYLGYQWILAGSQLLDELSTVIREISP